MTFLELHQQLEEKDFGYAGNVVANVLITRRKQVAHSSSPIDPSKVATRHRTISVRSTDSRRPCDLPYSLIIEATEDPIIFGFFSEELSGFTGVGHSIEDCL